MTRSKLFTAKEVREVYEKHGQPVDTTIDIPDDVRLDDSYEDRCWRIINTFKDGARLTTTWTGYRRGYSEMTPSSPGNIEFMLEESS